MKNKILMIAGAALGLATATALAADSEMSYDKGREFYRAGEFSFDAFGSDSVGKDTINHLSGNRISHDSRLGAGVGMNYFFTRMIGLGAMAYSEDTHGAFIDNAAADLLLRFPMGRFAPYALGGGGRQFERARGWFGEFGGGLEVRFTPKIGIFADGRAILPEHTTWYGLARLGLRFSF